MSLKCLTQLEQWEQVKIKSFQVDFTVIKRAILAGIMMSFARAIGEFGATLMLAGYIPNKTNTLPLEIYF